MVRIVFNLLVLLCCARTYPFRLMAKSLLPCYKSSCSLSLPVSRAVTTY